MRVVFQLRAQGIDACGKPRTMFSKRVFSDRTAAEGFADDFRVRCLGDGLYDLQSVESVTVIELELDEP